MTSHTYGDTPKEIIACAGFAAEPYHPARSESSLFIVVDRIFYQRALLSVAGNK